MTPGKTYVRYDGMEVVAIRPEGDEGIWRFVFNYAGRQHVWHGDATRVQEAEHARHNP